MTADLDWCPHCGGSLKSDPQLLKDDIFDDDLRSLHIKFIYYHISPIAWRILLALREGWNDPTGRGRVKSDDYLLDNSGINENADPKIIKVYISKLRNDLKETPYGISRIRYQGYYLFRKGTGQ